MLMQVRNQGDEVVIELNGIAGRQQQVLLALTECQRHACAGHEDQPLQPSDVAVRAGANDMRIRLKGRAGLNFEATAIYRCLRHALIEAPAERRAAAVAAG
jgi:hypothetical protein